MKENNEQINFLLKQIQLTVNDINTSDYVSEKSKELLSKYVEELRLEVSE